MSMLKAGRPTANKQALTMGDIAGGEKMKRVNFELTEELHKKLKTYAVTQGKSIKDILTEFVEGL